MTMTFLAPAGRARLTSVATTDGLVVTAYLGARGCPMLGLITTTSPGLTNLRIPPMAAMAFLVFVPADVPWATARSLPAAPAAAGKILAVAHGTSAGTNTKKAIAAIEGMRKFVSPGDVVVIKPNIGHPRAPKYAVTTSPSVVATLVSLARQAGAKKVIVMDNPVSSDPAHCYSASKISAAVKAAGGSMKVMGSSGYKRYAIHGHLLKTHPLYAAIVNADVLINVPIAKQHGSTGLTLAGKNMMGCTSNRQKMHTLGLSQSIAEINAKLRPELTVIDAMRILVHNGPSGGSLSDVRTKNTVIACKDWVAADTYA